MTGSSPASGGGRPQWGRALTAGCPRGSSAVLGVLAGVTSRLQKEKRADSKAAPKGRMSTADMPRSRVTRTALALS